MILAMMTPSLGLCDIEDDQLQFLIKGKTFVCDITLILLQGSIIDALDRKIETLLRDWHQSPDMLFSIHPIDGSFLVWYVYTSVCINYVTSPQLQGNVCKIFYKRKQTQVLPYYSDLLQEVGL